MSTESCMRRIMDGSHQNAQAAEPALAATTAAEPSARPLLWAVHACFPGIRLVWADSGYTGQLVDWAAEHL